MDYGLAAGMPYSLSRWCDLAERWSWVESCLHTQKMVALDPLTFEPKVWSLDPDQTISLVFWTQNPGPLIASQLRLQRYHLWVHLRTGLWSGAPDLALSGRLLIEAAKAYPNVRWHFVLTSALSDRTVIEAFSRMLGSACVAGLREVYFSFERPGGLGVFERLYLLNRLADKASSAGVRVILCAGDHGMDDLLYGARFDVEPCVKPTDFPVSRVLVDASGSVRLVDPFSADASYQGGAVTRVRKRISSNELHLVR